MLVFTCIKLRNIIYFRKFNSCIIGKKCLLSCIKKETARTQVHIRVILSASIFHAITVHAVILFKKNEFFQF